ncbi:MAG TPA: hypothetical protein VMF90_06020 [Rhizobiaceae bacterium]|nr:hypothetical protein [Rhizobiaceae bacterium]
MITFQPVAEEAKPDYGIVRKMAEKMREMGMNGLAVTVESLVEHSEWTRDEVKRFAPEAADLAKSMSVVDRRAA